MKRQPNRSTPLTLNVSTSEEIIEADPLRMWCKIHNHTGSGITLFISYYTAPTVDACREELEEGDSFCTDYQGDIYVTSDSGAVVPIRVEEDF